MYDSIIFLQDFSAPSIENAWVLNDSVLTDSAFRAVPHPWITVFYGGPASMNVRRRLPVLPSPDTVKLNTKLNAILTKDVDKILAEDVYLPFVGRGYTRATLEAWLASRADILTQAQGATVAQIDQRIDTYYQSLTFADKAIADKILDGLDYDLSLASDFNAYEKLVAVVLSTFITRTQ